MEQTFKQQPLIFTDYTPSEIVGAENMHILKKHLRMSIQHGGEFPVAQLKKEVGSDARDWVAQVLEALAKHGYYPLAVDEKGIRWGVTLKSEVQVEMEKGMKDLRLKSRRELQDLARGGYREVGKKQGGYKERDKAPPRWETDLTAMV